MSLGIDKVAQKYVQEMVFYVNVFNLNTKVNYLMTFLSHPRAVDESSS